MGITGNMDHMLKDIIEIGGSRVKLSIFSLQIKIISLSL